MHRVEIIFKNDYPNNNGYFLWDRYRRAPVARNNIFHRNFESRLPIWQTVHDIQLDCELVRETFYIYVRNTYIHTYILVCESVSACDITLFVLSVQWKNTGWGIRADGFVFWLYVLRRASTSCKINFSVIYYNKQPLLSRNNKQFKTYCENTRLARNAYSVFFLRGIIFITNFKTRELSYRL